MEESKNNGSREEQRYDADLFSCPVKAGKRTYFFDVKSTRDGEYYLTITESKRHVDDDGRFTYEKHKIFLYKEDFESFIAGMQETMDYIKTNNPGIRPRVERYSTDGTDSGDVKFEDLGKE
ncbi:DNA-binding protein [Bacteroidia bacterium]|nr:DNA-binding protein [Bacteroidia bacterium]